MNLKTGFTFFALMFCVAFCFGQGAWTQKASFGGGNRFDAAEFSMGNLGYICAGGSNTSRFKDLWEYDPIADTWTQKASMPIGVRTDPVAFVIDTCAYVGTGYGSASLFYSDFWKWNQTANIWTQIANYPGNGGNGLSAGIAFAIGGKGYVGAGGGWAAGPLSCSDEFWEYDPSTDVWTQKTNFAGGPRWFAIGFAIGNKGYAGTGFHCTSSVFTYYHDFWEYDPVSDTWTQKADIGDSTRAYAAGFSIGNKGYIGMGWITDGTGMYYTDFWEWNSATNTWTQKANYPGAGVSTCSGFAIGTKGYMGIGGAPNTNAKQDFWEFDPTLVGINELENSQHIKVFPNPATEFLRMEFESAEPRTIAIYDCKGRKVHEQKSDASFIEIDIGNFAPSTYVYSVSGKCGAASSGQFTVK